MLIEDFQIKRFRGLRELALPELGQINLFMGPNNSGKSTVLEALALWADPTAVAQWHTVAQMRSGWPFIEMQGYPVTQRIEWLFPHLDRESIEHIELSAEGSQRRHIQCIHQLMRGDPTTDRTRTARDVMYFSAARAYPSWQESDQPGTQVIVSVSNEDTPPVEVGLEFWLHRPRPRNRRRVNRVPHALISAFSHRSADLLERQWSTAVKERFEDAVVALAQRVDSGIRGLQILNEGEEGARGLFVDHATRGFLPLEAFGDGSRRAIHFALAIPAARGGVLLIDEIEIAIHASVIGSVFNWLTDACVEHDVQLFATTHSLEAIDAIVGSLPEGRADIVAWQLSKGAVEKRLCGDLLRRLRFERGLEVRG